MIREDDLQRLHTIARTYKVELERVTTSSLSFSKTGGPSGYARLNLSNRVVRYADPADFEHVLHEIVHIALHPAYFQFELVPEEFLLLQFERCLRLPKRLRAGVLKWQGGTLVPLLHEEAFLQEIDGYQNTNVWRAGFRRARQLGIIDDKNRPTGKLPTWTDEIFAELATNIGTLAAEREARRVARLRSFGLSTDGPSGTISSSR